jgi:hypothetical protein
MTVLKCWTAKYSAYGSGHHNHVKHYSKTANDKFFASKVAGDEALEMASHSLNDTPAIKYDIPQRVRQKLMSAEDAVALVQDGDTVCVSGFVTQGKDCTFENGTNC